MQYYHFLFRINSRKLKTVFYGTIKGVVLHRKNHRIYFSTSVEEDVFFGKIVELKLQPMLWQCHAGHVRWGQTRCLVGTACEQSVMSYTNTPQVIHQLERLCSGRFKPVTNDRTFSLDLQSEYGVTYTRLAFAFDHSQPLSVSSVLCHNSMCL